MKTLNNPLKIFSAGLKSEAETQSEETVVLRGLFLCVIF
jgi:hypothetical protein